MKRRRGEWENMRKEEFEIRRRLNN